MANMAITLDTPKSTPRVVRKDLSLWSRRLLTPRRTARINVEDCMSLYLAAVVLYAFDCTVLETQNTVRTLSHLGFMGHDKDGLALRV